MTNEIASVKLDTSKVNYHIQITLKQNFKTMLHYNRVLKKVVYFTLLNTINYIFVWMSEYILKH